MEEMPDVHDLGLHYAPPPVGRIRAADDAAPHLFSGCTDCESSDFGIGTYLIRRDGRVENRQNILFLAGLTVINILTALDILSYYMSWAAFLALLVWSFFGGGRGR